MPSILHVLILYQLEILFFFPVGNTVSYNIQYQSLKNTQFIFLMLKGVWQLTLVWWQWFLAAFILSFWPCPPSCKLSLSAPSSVFVWKAKEWKEKMVPVTSVSFYPGRQCLPKAPTDFCFCFLSWHCHLASQLAREIEKSSITFF